MYIIFGGDYCPSCHKARGILETLQIPFKYYDLDDTESVEHLQSIFGTPKTIPVVFYNDMHIGGYEKLVEHINMQKEIER